jgi:hypothetical protein
MAAMWLLDKIAEARISEAVERGEFDNLPGAGQPLELDDDALVPEELRAAYRLLKNAGYLPPALQMRREIHDVRELLRAAEEPAESGRLARRLNHLLAALSAARGGQGDLRVDADYHRQLLQHMERRERQAP